MRGVESLQGGRKKKKRERVFGDLKPGGLYEPKARLALAFLIYDHVALSTKDKQYFEVSKLTILPFVSLSQEAKTDCEKC